MRRSHSVRVSRLLQVLGSLFLLLLLGCGSMGSLLGGGGTATREVLHEIIDRGALRVGTSGHQPPLSMKNQRGELIGTVTRATLESLLLPLAEAEGDIHITAYGRRVFA